MSNSSVSVNGQSFGKKRTITKFPRLLSKVREKLSRHDDSEVTAKSASLVATLRDVGQVEDSKPSLEALEVLEEALEPLVELLFQEGSPKLQEQGAKAIGTVASQVEAEICELMVQHPRLLEGLVGLIAKSKHHGLQEHATFALVNLADGEECQRLIASYPNAIAGLVDLLSQDRHTPLLQYGASTLFLLGLVEENRKMIIEFPGALEGLVRVLLKDGMPQLQSRAALALSILAASDADTKLTIAKFPQALAGIMALLELEELPDVQECAAGAVANLISAETTPMILEFPNVLARLVLLVAKCEAALVAIVNLDFYRKKQAVKQMAEQALVRCRRLPQFRLLNYSNNA